MKHLSRYPAHLIRGEKKEVFPEERMEQLLQFLDINALIFPPHAHCCDSECRREGEEDEREACRRSKPDKPHTQLPEGGKKGTKCALPFADGARGA